MNRDLTVGSPGKVLLQYSLPLFGSMLFQQLYNLADSIVAGRYIGTDALAAVGNAYELTLLYISFAFGCNIGVSVITAHFFGAKDYKNTRSAISTSILTCSAFAVIFTVLGLLFMPQLLQLINTPTEIYADCLDYLNIYVCSFVFVLAYNIATAIFSALGDSRTPFLFLAVSSVANVILDIVFVRDLQMGVPGVAWATFLCQSLSAVLSVAVILRRLKSLPADGKAPVFSVPILKKIAAVAIPSILQQYVISIANVTIQGLVNSFGTAATAGYAASVKFQSMAISSVNALSSGMSSYTSQNMGAEKPQRIGPGLRSGVLLGLAVSVLLSAGFVIFSGPLVRLFITDGDLEAMAVGQNFLRTVMPFFPLLGVKLVIDGVFRGINKMSYFVGTTSFELVLRLFLAFFVTAPLGLSYLWCAWPVGWFITLTVTIFLYRRSARLGHDFSKQK